jgi:F-type H+-transporting ATPase subunit delta
LTQSSATQLSDVARRYAGALFGLAREKDKLAIVSDQLAAFRALVAGNAALKLTLESPAIKIEDKSKALTAIAEKAGYDPVVVNFIGVMAGNGRSAELLSATHGFDALYADHRGIKRVIASTAHKMTAAQEKKLSTLLAKSVGSDIELETRVVPDLIGGVRLQIGSTLIDASIAAKLDRMNIAMKGA